MTQQNSVIELALFSLKNKGLNDYLGNYDSFSSSIKQLDGFKWLHTFQNIHNPDELLDIAEWENLEKAQKADETVQQSAEFKKLFGPIEKVEYFNHVRQLGMRSTREMDENTLLELYVYRVEEEKREEHVKAKQEFAEYLASEVEGFHDLIWFEVIGDEQWHVDLYFYELFDGIEENNKAIEEHEVSQKLMQTIAELKYFKTFTQLKTDRVKTDLTKTNKPYYKAAKKAEELELRSHRFLSVNGIGAPDSAQFDKAISDIYSVAYKVKFNCKAIGHDFVVPKMEAFWYVEEGKDFAESERDEWHWQVMIPLPEFVHPSIVKTTIDNLDLAERVSLKRQEPARHVQIMHLGSYDQEEESIGKVHGYIENQGYKMAGYHREIYLNDPRKTPEEKLKTIIRYQIA